MSYKVYAGLQTDVDTWKTKICIHDISDITDTKKLISPTLTREVGKAGSFEFTMPLGNVAHSALQKLRTTVEVEQDGVSIWQGRPMSHEQDFLMRQKIYCEGELAYLNDSGIAPYAAKNVSFSQFLEWICDNHNGMVDAYKAFTPGNVQMDIPMIVPYIDGIKVVQVGYSYDSNDGDYIYHWGIVDPVDGKTNIFYEETEINKASCLSWEIDEEHIAEGRIISRIGSNNFRVRLFAAYVKGKTYAAKVEVKKAEIVCGTCNKNFGTYSIYNVEQASESKTFKITEQNGKYILAINGKTDSRFLFDVKEPTYSFGDGKNYGVTWDILQSELVEKYGGYLVLRHAEDPDGKPRRYLDYLQAITDKNSQTVAFGTNLLDLTNNVKAEDIYTRVIAVGAKKITWLVFSWGETITETANDLAAQKLFGIITKVIFIEGIESTPQSLLDAAEEELAKNLRYLNGMTVKAVDLKDADIDVSRIAIGKQTHIFSAPHGVDTWLLCSKLVEPLDSPDKKEFTFGTEFSSISDLQALSARKASDAYDLSRSLKGYMSG